MPGNESELARRHRELARFWELAATAKDDLARENAITAIQLLEGRLQGARGARIPSVKDDPLSRSITDLRALVARYRAVIPQLENPEDQAAVRESIQKLEERIVDVARLTLGP
jgi:hypothetical protein